MNQDDRWMEYICEKIKALSSLSEVRRQPNAVEGPRVCLRHDVLS